MSGSLVSVILPTYQSAATLSEAVESVLSQTYADLELIVVNDGSTDESADILSCFAKSDMRVKLVHQANAGAPAARNRGRSLASGEFLLFTDSDVVLAPRLVERQLSALRAAPAAAYAYCDFSVRSAEGSWREPVFRAQYFDPSSLRRSNYVSAISLVRAQLMPEWDLELRALQDWDAWLTLLDRGYGGVYVPEVLFETIDRKESITQAWSRNHHSEALATVRSKHSRLATVCLWPDGSIDAAENWLDSVSRSLGASSPMFALNLGEEPFESIEELAQHYEYLLLVDPVDRLPAGSWPQRVLRLAFYLQSPSILWIDSKAPQASLALTGNVLDCVLTYPGEACDGPVLVASSDLMRIGRPADRSALIANATGQGLPVFGCLLL